MVHNIKSNSQRLVKITPSSSWGGAGLLGVTIRLDNYGGADERLIRVLSVEHNSPAAIAGLTPMSDYLLGTTSASFDSDDVLAEVLMMHVDRIVEIYVYSSESDLVRVVTLMPTKSWGGSGLLGAEVGTGYLHRFPKSCRGTDGKSVERKIRMGVRPTEASALEGKKLANAQDIDNETAITDEASGKTMCFAEQMEMEPEPSEVQQHGDGKPFENTNNKEDSTTEQTGGEYSNEADAIFSRPPPENAVSTLTQQQSNTVPTRVTHRDRLPPPPYASYSSQHPPQPVSPIVDLR